ncbi:MAG: sensor histidine kinase [Haloarculaceae archaeon]
MGVEQLSLRALLIEDNPGDARLVEHHLNAPNVYEIAGDVTLHHETSLDDGLAELADGGYDVLFLDLGLPESTGLATLDRVLAEGTRLPIVVLTGLDNRETAVEAIQRGAQDYLPKDDLDADLLARSLRYAVERYRQEEKLRRQNERLDEFVSVVSHDLRNPLNVAMARIEIARRECDSDHLDDAATALDRMEALIADLLTLARNGEGISETGPVSLAAVVETCWDTVATDRATLRLGPGADRTLECDESRLRQLLENLVRNAVEHGGGDVRVTVGTLPDGFYVADTGSGLPEGERDRVLESGFSTSEDGTGFGLSIAQEIAGAHGWELGVAESEDGGARFEITGVEFVD